MVPMLDVIKTHFQIPDVVGATPISQITSVANPLRYLGIKVR
jgi:hypothetical protein